MSELNKETLQPAYPSYGFTPAYLSGESAWIQHLPFAYDLVKEYKPELFVELGTWNGDSFFTFCQSVAENNIKAQCYAVDHWKGDSQAGYVDTSQFARVQKYCVEKYSQFAYLLRTDFDSAAKEFSEESIDILHIDGLHTYEAVANDYHTWHPKVKQGGLIIFHDIAVRSSDDHENFGVWRLWEKLKTQHISFEFTHGHGLGILIKGHQGNITEWLHRACNGLTATYYAHKGRDIAICAEKQALEQQAGQLQLKQAEFEKLALQSKKHSQTETELNKARDEYAALLEKYNTVTVELETKCKKCSELAADGKLAHSLKEKLSRRIGELEQSNRAQESRISQTGQILKAVRDKLKDTGNVKYKRARMRQAMDEVRLEIDSIIAGHHRQYDKSDKHLREIEKRIKRAALAAGEACSNFISRLYVKKEKSELIDAHILEAAIAISQSDNDAFFSHIEKALQGIHQVLRKLDGKPLVKRTKIKKALAIREKSAREIKALKQSWAAAEKERKISSIPYLFDRHYYLEQAGIASTEPWTAYEHYRNKGWKEGLNPHPLFDVKWYLSNNPDVAVIEQDPLGHYLEKGWKEQRPPHPLCDIKWYLNSNPDVAAFGMDPLRHYLLHGWKEGRNPHPGINVQKYLKQNPDVTMEPLRHFLLHGKREGRRLDHETGLDVAETRLRIPALADAVTAKTTHQLLNDRFKSLSRMHIHMGTSAEPRVNLVTDSIEKGSLFGGVATAMIFATLLSKKLGAKLRIITRHEAPSAENFRHILDANGISCHENVDFQHADISDQKHAVELAEQDIFITTSWWSTRSVLNNVDPNKIIYLLQEDERMFYPAGDEQIMCQSVLQRQDIRFIINSKLLYDHLTTDPLLQHMSNASCWFEPSIMATVSSDVSWENAKSERFKLMFYAREKNLRNLFYMGVQVLNEAVDRGMLPPDQWDIIFAGNNFPATIFSDGREPKALKNLSWQEYADQIKNVDLGLCLMATPHPSYPPLDIAANGGVAVTNKFGLKHSLSRYSNNIICGELSVDGLLKALASGIDLAADKKQRRENLLAGKILQDWPASFEGVLDWIEPHVNRLKK